MKQRFTFLDVRAIVNELQTDLVNSYIQNVYSDKRRFIIKFNTNSLLIEPGVRIHFVKDYVHGLNNFSKVLRMLRRQKLRSVSQCGFDRIALLDFGDYKLYIEFFSAGNMIITNSANLILQLLRTIPGLYETNQVYVVNNAELNLEVSVFCQTTFKKFLPMDNLILKDIRAQLEGVVGMDLEVFKDEVVRNATDGSGGAGNDLESDLEKLHVEGQGSAHSKGRTKDLGDRIRRFNEFTGELVLKIRDVKSFGILVFKDNEPDNVFPMDIHQDVKSLTFRSFNEACQHYFVDKVKTEVPRGVVVESKQNIRIKELEKSILDNKAKAELIKEDPLAAEIFNVFHIVETCRMDWKEFFDFKEKETKKGNTVSTAIKKLDFVKKTALITLENTDIEVFINKNIHYNVSFYYEKAKHCEGKLEKTIDALKKLPKNVKEKRDLVRVEKRKVYWFEKFHFVLLTDNIVLSGKNAQQNETLVKKFLKNLYFHCTVQGGSSVILESFDCEVDMKTYDVSEVKAPSKCPDAVDNITLAGEVALCMSKCWNQKVSHPVFYVQADQVSKSAPTGEHITKGSFLIRGKKNEINVYKLEYGVGILFRIAVPKIIIQARPDTEGRETQEDTERMYFCIDPNGRDIGHSMVVTGPWSLLRAFKYKAKLLTGATKKGQLVKEVQALFHKGSSGAENESMRKIHPDEYMNVLPPNVRLGKF